MQRTVFPLFLLLTILVFSSGTAARGVYQSQEAFLNEVFNQAPPKPSVIWLSGETKTTAADILQHKPDYLRLRYWANKHKSAWILNEIGKEQPITLGIVIENGKIKLLRVLEFRESRGDEVRHNFFTQQFIDAQLESGNRLSKSIDGITGATLSVRALKRLARLALYLDSKRKPVSK